MQASVKSIASLRAAAAGALVAAFGVVASLAITALAGTKTGIALAIAAIAGPVLVYLGIVTPIVFPFTVYVMLVPFDNILNLSSFGTVTKLMAIASGFAILFYLVRTHRAVKPNAAVLLWVGWLLWCTATAFWAIDPASVFALLPTALELLVLYVAVSILPADRRATMWVSVATLAGGVVAAAYGSYLFRSGLDVGRGDRLWITTDTSFIDPNHFGASLLLPLAIAMAMTLYARKPLTFGVGLLATLALLEGVLVSASRGAFLGVGAIAIYLLIRSRRRLRLLAALVPAAAIAFAMEGASLIDRFGTALTSGGSGRVDIWKVGLGALKMHWLLGAGFNNFAFAYDEAFMTAHQQQFAQWHRAPHNLLLGTAVELGVVGLALLLAAWGAQFRLLRNIAPGDAEYPLRLALEAALIAIFVAALFLDVMVMKYLWLAFMLVAVVANAHAARAHTTASAKEIPSHA